MITLNNGKQIPQIGVGTWTLKGNVATNNVRQAIEAGFRHIDTAYAEIKPVINQIEVHPFMSQEENIAYNHSLGIQVQAWGPFGQGDIDVVGDQTLQSLAKKHNKTASQIVLRWIVQRGLITIPRAKPNHFAENLEIMKFELDADDMQTINALNRNLRSNALNDPETFPW